MEVKYALGQIVYLITDPEQMPRMVIEIIVSEGGVRYVLAMGGQVTIHYEMEIAEEENKMIKFNLN